MAADFLSDPREWQGSLKEGEQGAGEMVRWVLEPMQGGSQFPPQEPPQAPAFTCTHPHTQAEIHSKNYKGGRQEEGAKAERQSRGSKDQKEGQGTRARRRCAPCGESGCVLHVGSGELYSMSEVRSSAFL